MKFLSCQIILLVILVYQSVSQTCPAYSGGYTSQSPSSGSQSVGVYLDALPSHLIPCDGTVYAWHYCYYPTTTNESHSLPDAVFAVYHYDNSSESYLLRQGSRYPLYLGSRQDVFSCGTVHLNESDYFRVFAGDVVGVCLMEAGSAQNQQLDVVTSRAQGSAVHWRTVSHHCGLSDIAQSVEDYQQNMPYSVHLFVDININECVVGEHNCSGTHGACSDVVGGRDSFQCSCLPGYSGNGVDTCENVNECALGLDTCDDTSTDCVDTDGSFTCTCKDGFANGETGSCTNIDECSVGVAECDVNSDCIDTVGSYSCLCRPGYTGDGRTRCLDVVSDVGCLSASQCPENSECLGTGTDSSCVCRVGYARDNNSCIDINECLLTEGGCDSHSDCINTAGSFGCLCKLGYTGNGITCTNVDECAEESDKCVSNADCEDTDGSYTCECSPGFIGDGLVGCRPILDCIEECDIHAICVHINGGSECICDVGYTGDGYTCAVTATSQGSESNALTIIGALFGAFGIFIFFFCVASVFAKGAVYQNTSVESHLADRGLKTCSHQITRTVTQNMWSYQMEL